MRVTAESVFRALAEHLIVLEGAPLPDASASVGDKRRAPPVSREEWSLKVYKEKFMKPIVKQIKSRWNRFKEYFEKFHFETFKKYVAKFPGMPANAFKGATTVANMKAAVPTWLPYLKKEFEESFDVGGTFGPLRVFKTTIDTHGAPISDGMLLCVSCSPFPSLSFSISPSLPLSFYHPPRSISLPVSLSLSISRYLALYLSRSHHPFCLAFSFILAYLAYLALPPYHSLHASLSFAISFSLSLDAQRSRLRATRSSR